MTKKREALKEAKDADAMQAWAHKILAWHDTLAPVFNMMRTVIVPHFLHSTRNRTLLRLVLGLEAFIGGSEINMIHLRRHPDFSAAINLKVFASYIGAIARIVNVCASTLYYLEQAQICGVKDIDDWAGY